MENLNGIGKVVGALAVGALVGAVLGVLFAPEKGSRTRNNIVDGAKDLADDIKRKLKNEAEALRQKANDLEEQAREKVEETIHNVKNATEEATTAKK